MKTIGLIGGTGWISTIEYYRLINEETNRRRGGQGTARIALDSLDFGEIHALHAKGEFERVGAIVTDAARKLERIGAQCVLLCANTTHMHAEAIRAAVAVPLIHIVEATAERIRAKGLKRVGLLGTRVTMEHEFYRSKLAEAGIGVLVPDEGDRGFIQRTIDEELMKSVLVSSSRQRFVEIIRTLAAEGAEGVVLGCTEIPLLVRQEDSPLPAFDTTRIHALATVEFALQS